MDETGSDQTASPLDALIGSARDGSAEAVGKLLEQFRPYLLQIAFDEVNPELRVKEAPSDLVQRSFLEACQSFDGFHGESAEVLRAWLRRILLHNIDDLRERYRTGKRELHREADIVGLVIPTDATPPSEIAIRREQAEVLDAALGKLAPEARAVIALRHRDGRSFAEIAALLQISEAAARKRWARAVEELRELVSDEPALRTEVDRGGQHDQSQPRTTG